MKKQYFYVKHDEYKIIFDDSDQLLKFLSDNTSEDEEAEVGSLELNNEEYKEMLNNVPKDI